MQPHFAAHLPHRSVIRISGTDRHSFLQGLVSNNVAKSADTDAIYAALLTPQGKFLHDLFILSPEGAFPPDGAFLIDCERERSEDLLDRLKAYKLRSKVKFDDLGEALDVWAVWEAPTAHYTPTPPSPLQWHERGLFLDPRLPKLGAREFIEKGRAPADTVAVELAAYDEHRLALGIADGSRDLEIEKSTLIEANFDFLNGIDWKKGCYIGQELTARMHYRGLAKKRLFPVEIEGKAPPFGAIIAKDIGEMRSSSGSTGIAVLKIEAVLQALDQKQPLTYGETKLWPTIPAWMKIDGTPTNR
jgi:folate-binding protein YgfZ